MVSENTLCGMWFRSAREFGEHPAFLVSEHGRRKAVSHAFFYAAVRDLAMGMLQAGIQRGDRLALLSENRLEWCLVDLACQCIGVIDIPVYPTLPPGETAEILHHSACRWAIVSTFLQFEKMLRIRERIPTVEKVFLIEGLGQRHREPWLSDLDDLTQAGQRIQSADEVFLAEIEKARPDDVASIIYTSGTTGFPKGVMLTHANFTSNIYAMAKAVATGPSDSCVSFLPLSHVFERTAGFYHMIFRGVTIAYTQNLEALVKDLAEIRPTVMLAVPRFYEKLYARTWESVKAGPWVRQMVFRWAFHTGRKNLRPAKSGRPSPLLAKQLSMAEKLVFSKLKAKLGGKIRFFVSGGAPLARPIAEFFEAAGIRILEGYGITECSPVVSVNRLESNRLGTVGRVLDGAEVRIAEDGEILVRGPNIMQGYFRMEKETRNVLLDGWFHTGDIGEFDAEGNLVITDRKKDMIINSGGKNIAPQRIEGLLKLDRYITDIIVHGDRRKYLVALVVPSFTHLENLAKSRGLPFRDRRDLVSRAEIRDFLLQRIHHRCRNLASFEKVRDIAILDREFNADDGEVTPTLKLRRKRIEERFRKELDALYPADHIPQS